MLHHRPEGYTNAVPASPDVNNRPGYVQPTLAQLVRVRGLSSVYHLNAIQSWKIARDGTVSNVHA
jgi:hypothetical protein